MFRAVVYEHPLIVVLLFPLVLKVGSDRNLTSLPLFCFKKENASHKLFVFKVHDNEACS